MIDLNEKFHFQFKNKNKAIKYDDFKLCSALVIFLKYKLLDREFKKIIPINIGFCEIKESNGIFLVEGSICHIFIDIKKIKEQDIYTKKIKSLFHVLLHEISHYLDFLDFYNKNSIESIKDAFKKHFEKNCFHKKDYIKSDAYTFISKHSNHPGEFLANRFAAENMSLFENLYEVGTYINIPEDEST